MSQIEADITPREVVRFVEKNTSPNAKWCSREEIVWVLSWYENAENGHIKRALDIAVSEGLLVADRNRYTLPSLT